MVSSLFFFIWSSTRRRRDASATSEGAGGTQAPHPKAQAGRTAPHPKAQAGRTAPPPTARCRFATRREDAAATSHQKTPVKGLFILVPALLLN